METAGQQAWLSPPAVLARLSLVVEGVLLHAENPKIAQSPRTKVIVG